MSLTELKHTIHIAISVRILAFIEHEGICICTIVFPFKSDVYLYMALKSVIFTEAPSRIQDAYEAILQGALKPPSYTPSKHKNLLNTGF